VTCILAYLKFFLFCVSGAVFSSDVAQEQAAAPSCFFLFFFFVSPGPFYTTLQFYFEFILCGPYRKFQLKKESSSANSTNNTRRKHGNEEKLPRRYRLVLKSHFLLQSVKAICKWRNLRNFEKFLE
jgi:hypothetical protein